MAENRVLNVVYNRKKRTRTELWNVSSLTEEVQQREEQCVLVDLNVLGFLERYVLITVLCITRFSPGRLSRIKHIPTATMHFRFH